MKSSFKIMDAYLEDTHLILTDLADKFSQINFILDVLSTAREEGSTVFICGNGGSSSAASHFANDLAKFTIVEDKKRFKAICLSDNVPLLTAWANDSGYENVFSGQLANLLEPNDIVIGISGSGNSPNVLNAVRYANEHEAVTIGLTGRDGGKLKDLANVCLIVPSDNMQHIEDIHLLLVHLFVIILRSELEKE